MRFAVITDFTEGDIEQLKKEYLKVLSKNKPGDVLSWENKSTKHGGEITVIRQFKQDGNSCKRLKFLNRSKHQSATSYFNFCFIDKQWTVTV